MTSSSQIPWKRISAESIAIIASILLAFSIDTWWENRKEGNLEALYLSELREDFEISRTRLESQIDLLEQTISDLRRLQDEALLESPTLSVDDLNRKFTNILQMPTFFPANRAYANLLGARDLNLIQNRALKNALAGYFAAANVTELVQGTHEMELVQIYEPYIIQNLDYAAIYIARVDDFQPGGPSHETKILDVIGTSEFRNIIFQKWTISTDLLNQFRGMLERTNQILAML